MYACRTSRRGSSCVSGSWTILARKSARTSVSVSAPWNHGMPALTQRYTTQDIHCRHRRHECDGGIKTQSRTIDVFKIIVTCEWRPRCDCEGLVNGKRYQSRRIDDDYGYYNDYEVLKAGRGGRRRQNAAGWRRSIANSINARHTTAAAFLLMTLISTVLTLHLHRNNI